MFLLFYLSIALLISAFFPFNVLIYVASKLSIVNILLSISLLLSFQLVDFLIFSNNLISFFIFVSSKVVLIEFFFLHLIFLLALLYLVLIFILLVVVQCCKMVFSVIIIWDNLEKRISFNFLQSLEGVFV